MSSTSTTPKKSNAKDDKVRFPTAVSITAAALWVLLLLVTAMFHEKVGAFGQFGDTFGILNCVFSGGAFILLIHTANMQRKELELQRGEMEQTRAELEGQKDQLRIQNELSSVSARLAALPLMIENEYRSLQTFTRVPGRAQKGILVSDDWAKIAAEYREQARRNEQAEVREELLTIVERLEILAHLTGELDQLYAELAGPAAEARLKKIRLMAEAETPSANNLPVV